ncbi:retrovirus-related pol polyprotein from transposon TNT 1-94 [Tanacetum coccineum]
MTGPILPPPGASTDNPSSPNVNRVDTMHVNDSTNNTTTTNVARNVIEEINDNLPQLLDSRGGLEPYLITTLEEGPFVPLSTLSTSTNPLPKHQNQWSNTKSRLANQDKRLKNIIIDYLPNDVMKSVIKYKSAKEIKSSAGKLKIFYKRSGRESVSSEDEGITKFKALVAITEDEPSMGKGDARSGQWVEITMKRVHRLLSMTEGKERKHVLDYTHVDLQYVEDQRKDLVNKYNALKQDLALHKSELLLGNIVNAVGGRGRRKENNFSKEVVFTKADESSSGPALMITSDSEADIDSQEPLPPLPKLVRVEPSSISDNLISLSDLTANMSKMTLNTSSSKGNKKSSDKVSKSYVIKKKVDPVPPVVHVSCSDEKADSSTEQLLITLMEEVKGIKDHIKIPYVTSPSDSQASSTMPLKQKDYLKRSVWYLDSGCSRHMTRVKQYLHRFLKEPGPKVVFGDNSLGDTKGYGSVNCNGITFTRVAYVNAERRNRTLIEAAKTMLNSARLPKFFWGEAVNAACYTQNRSIIMKRHRKTTYEVFKGRALDISYLYVFGYPVHIHNHRDHLGNFDEKADDGFFLGYSQVA